jgi:hypothetical protein
VYQGRYFSQSAPITDAQVQALIDYGQSTQNSALSASGQAAGAIDPSLSGFNPTYNVLGGALGVQGLFGNNCISYVGGALNYAGITSGSAFRALALPEWNAGAARVRSRKDGHGRRGIGRTATASLGEQGQLALLDHLGAASDALPESRLREFSTHSYMTYTRVPRIVQQSRLAPPQ